MERRGNSTQSHQGTQVQQEDVKNGVKKNQTKSEKAARPHTIMNPLSKGVYEYLTKHLPLSHFSQYDLDRVSLVSSLPKRFSTYPPLLLLPLNAFSSTAQWKTLYSSLTEDQRHELYNCIAAPFASSGITHIAINAPISLTDASGNENRKRSPTGLVPLYGDFGLTPSGSGGDNGLQDEQPTDSELQAALWVRTVQNHGIVQIWAPLYSMFSRGNISEKARILGQRKRFDGLDGVDGTLGQALSDIAVVDMYAGIGYFVFSYLKRGVGRVWAWEINGWSVEGLVRGCRENGWGVKVVRVDDNGNPEGGIASLVEGISKQDQAVVFLGDNKFAADMMMEIKTRMESRGVWNRIRHVNLGLLPTSKLAWHGAVRMLDAEKGGWAHVHENIDVNLIDEKIEGIVQEFEELARSTKHKDSSDAATKTKCDYVERVKTYAPGVMHCVFDIHVPP